MISVKEQTDGGYEISVGKINSKKDEINTLIEVYEELDVLSSLILKKFNDSELRNNRNKK